MRLLAVYLFGKEDKTCTGAENGQTLCYHSFKLVIYIKLTEQLAHNGAFAARDYDAVHALLYIAFLTYLKRLHAKL